jgi:hypothetical protein
MQENKYPHMWFVGDKNKTCLRCRKINCDETEECMVAKREYLKDKNLRDEFAMQFKLLTDEEIEDHVKGGETPKECQARLAYSYADAMMKEREK